jgi:endonuclease/exonuclease/phosphatase family metal-dependent hydrolase
MTVCSFNIWSDAPRNARWPRRRDAVAAVLRELAPEVAGLQEATLPMLHDLQERLPEYRWVGVGRLDGHEAGEFTPIFYKVSRVALLEQASFWLSATSHLAGRGWDAAVCRIVTWARLRELESGREFVHCNTHFDHLGRRARRESALLLRKKAGELAQGGPLVITGDLNCSESSAPYRLLTGQLPFTAAEGSALELRDTFRASEQPAEGPPRTYLGLLGLLGMRRIDYILVNQGFRARRHRVVDVATRPSDHRPVVAELAFMG